MDKLILEKSAFDKFEELFKKQYIASQFRESKETSSFDALTAILPHFSEEDLRIFLEMYFLPDSNANSLDFVFECDFTVLENIKENCVDLVSEGISVLNAYLPFGAFSMRQTNDVVKYRVGTTFRNITSDEDLFTEMFNIFKNAVVVLKVYAAAVSKLANEKMSIEELFNFIGTEGF